MIAEEGIDIIKEKSRQIRKPLPALLFLLFLDSLVFIFFFSLNHVFRPDILAIIVYLSLYVYLILTKRKKDIAYLFISSVIAIIWTIFAKNNYGYDRDMIYIFGLSAFPLFAWSTGLAAIYLLYHDIDQIFMKNNGCLKRFLLFTVLYFFFIIVLETIAYHVFGIRNVATEIYPGLPICNCIHAPRWMQISYFLIGPIYFAISRFYKLNMTKWT
jgi:hypothetical protein